MILKEKIINLIKDKPSLKDKELLNIHLIK